MTLRQWTHTEPSALIDAYGRVHHDLRVSVTDRCGLRCTYCMPERVVPLPTGTLLSATEIERLVGVAVTLGVRRVRLTGGEPLLRADLVEIVTRLAALPDPPELALTTSGVGLDRLAAPLAAAGLRRVNVSMDTLDPATYAAITGRDRLAAVRAGLAAARAAGLGPIKLNAVLLRGINDVQAPALLEFALDEGYELRFIEQMPLGRARWDRASLVTADEILERLGRSHTLTPVAVRGHAPAARWLVDGGPGAVGIIAAVSRPFCGDCDRLRLTADGFLRSCLFALAEQDLRTPLRAGATDADLAQVFAAGVAAKPAGHAIGRRDFRAPARTMSAIGG